MLTTLFAFLSTSYVAWYFQTYELAAVYPFDTTYASPAEAGAPWLEETAFETDDGARLVVWRARARADRPTILYLSGNAGTLSDRAARFKDLIDQGYGLVAPAYRGSSGSTGSPDETRLISDAVAVVAEIDGPVVFYGESLGAAIAIRLAAAGKGDALVLEAPFTSIPELVAAQYPAEDLGGLITQRWESLETVGAVRQPLLVIHGDADRIVPFEMGQRIFEKAGSSRKRFLHVPDEGHTALWTVDVRATIFEFLGDSF